MRVYAWCLEVYNVSVIRVYDVLKFIASITVSSRFYLSIYMFIWIICLDKIIAWIHILVIKYTCCSFVKQFFTHCLYFISAYYIHILMTDYVLTHAENN